MDEEWLSAGEARRLVANAIPIGAEQAICARANDGLIAARATRLVIGDRITDESEVPKGFWWSRGGLEFWQHWDLGDFATWIDRKVHCRAYGVRFRKSDIDAMVPRRPESIFSMAEPGNYASAARCIAELTSHLNCTSTEAERMVIRGCRAGLVPSRCTEISVRIRNR